MIYDDQGNILLTWKGKTKTIKEWCDDPDCVVDVPKTLQNRVTRLKWDDEKCLTHPIRVTMPKFVEIDGETKRVTEWFADPRCRVERIETFYRRLTDGIDPKTALTTPSGHLWGTAITAWGETKMPGDWQEDCRCRVHARTIVKRIDSGMTPELAIRTPSPKPMERSAQEWFEREIQAQRLLGELKGTVPLSALQQAMQRAGVKEGEVSFSNRQPDGEGSFCLGIWADVRALPRMVYASAQGPAAEVMWRLWKTNPAPQRMHGGYLYLFRHWFATDEHDTVLFV